MRILLTTIVLTAILFTGCQPGETENKVISDVRISQFILPEVTIIKESFSTARDESDNVDSPAVWHGAGGENWVLATAKEGNAIIVYDAATGEKISSFGKYGTMPGELSRPNGIAVIDNYAVVVERDNHRVQVFTLPEFKSLGFFGETVLRKPYGITIDYFEGQFNLFITDNYEMPDESTPPTDSLGHRVHHFTFTVEDGNLKAGHIKAFGETAGDGVLYKVESILLDREYDRLLIADEHELHRNVKIYNLNGDYTGVVVSHKYFFYEPEGIVLWQCPEDKSGYYIMTDQGKISNTFQVFDRATLEYIGGFSGEITRNTDGIAITQKSFDNFLNGAFYPVHDDGSITAIGWDEIAEVLNIRKSCSN